MKKVVLLMSMAIGMIACGKPGGGSIGYVDFSKHALAFDARGGKDSVVTINTISDAWFIFWLRVDGKNYDVIKTAEMPGIDTSGTNMDIILEFVSQDGITGTVEGPWFTIEKPTRQKLVFSVDPNTTGKDRTLKVVIDESNYLRDIDIAQSAK
jgi:hypothetical protein